MCRAVYRDSDIMLLDDPLSAVDTAVSRHLFDAYVSTLYMTYYNENCKISTLLFQTDPLAFYSLPLLCLPGTIP